MPAALRVAGDGYRIGVGDLSDQNLVADGDDRGFHASSLLRTSRVRFAGGPGVGDQGAAYVAHEARSFVDDIPCAELYQVGARGEACRRHVVGRRHEAARKADDGVRLRPSARGCGARSRSSALRERTPERRPAPMRSITPGEGAQPLAAVRAVGGHDAVERRFDQHVGDAVDRLVAQVGRDFQQDWAVLVLSAPEVEQRFEQAQDVLARVWVVLSHSPLPQLMFTVK